MIYQRPVGVLCSYNKRCEKNRNVVYRLPSPLQFGAHDLGYSFLGSGGEPTEVVVVDLKVRSKSRKMSRERSEEEDGVVGTEVGPMSNENVETEVDYRPLRGTNQMLDDRPIIMGAVGA